MDGSAEYYRTNPWILKPERKSTVNKIYDYDVILIGLGECENISLFDEIYIVRDNNLVGIARAAKVFDHCALCKITLKRLEVKLNDKIITKVP